MAVVHIFFTIYIDFHKASIYISLLLVSIGCGLFSSSLSTDISRFDSLLSESKHRSFMVSLREHEGRCYASLAGAWRRLQAVRWWIYLRDRLSCYAACGPCGSTVSSTLATMPQPILSCTFPASG